MLNSSTYLERKPNIDDLIDNFLNTDNYKLLIAHEVEIKTWKLQCEDIIENSSSIFKKRRLLQYDECINDSNAYVFIMTRTVTRYKQQNYVEHHTKSLKKNKDFLILMTI